MGQQHGLAGQITLARHHLHLAVLNAPVRIRVAGLVAHILPGHAVHDLAARQGLSVQIRHVSGLRAFFGHCALARPHPVRRAAARRQSGVDRGEIVGAVTVRR